MAQKTHILTEEQIAFLNFASTYSSFSKVYYLTGGTALSEFYLQHRHSEDLDFFVEKSEVNLLPIQKLIKQAQKKFKLKKVTYQNYLGLHNFFLMFPNEKELKVDFNYYPFPRIQKGLKYNSLEIDSLLDIAVNKVHTIATRTSARDFIDIYFISRESAQTISDLIKKARAKFDFYIDPIQYGKQFSKVTQLKDYPRMLKPLDKHQLIDFFLTEARKLGKKILK